MKRLIKCNNNDIGESFYYCGYLVRCTNIGWEVVDDWNSVVAGPFPDWIEAEDFIDENLKG